jgi:holliday junction DNA helicase RuvA
MIGMLGGVCFSCEKHERVGFLTTVIVDGPEPHVGYEVRTKSEYHESENVGPLHTRMIVREQEITLYGFDSSRERALFDKLIKHVSKCGPSLAFAVIVGMSHADLAAAVVRGDVATLAKVKGVGKTTAENICRELGPKIRDLAGIVTDESVPAPRTKDEKWIATDRDFRSGLKNMGFSATEIAMCHEAAADLIAAGDLDGALRVALRKGKA